MSKQRHYAKDEERTFCGLEIGVKNLTYAVRVETITCYSCARAVVRAAVTGVKGRAPLLAKEIDREVKIFRKSLKSSAKA